MSNRTLSLGSIITCMLICYTLPLAHSMIMTDPTETVYVVLFTGGVSVMLVVHVLVVYWAIRGRIGFRDTRRANEERVEDVYGGGGLSPGELATLPCHDFKSADGGDGDCAVCLEVFEASDRCRQLPRCEHRFHAECIDLWLRKSGACPVCRADVLDRAPQGETKAAASSGVVEMAESRSSNAALEIVVTER